jgi:hypothetical protein
MDVISLLNNKSLKSIDKREEIAEAIRLKHITIKELQPLKDILDDKKMALVLEAMEAVTGKNPEIADLEWLKYTQDFIVSKSNNLKRESSRIVGNIAHLFPNCLETAIWNLMENRGNDSTIIRWASAYALSRIILISQYANSKLYDVLFDLCEQEKENGVKNQYLNGLKKAKKLKQQKY